MGDTDSSIEFYIQYLHENCRESCYVYALNKVHNARAAEDIVYKCFYNILARRPGFASLKNAERYLFKAVSNACKDYLKEHELEQLDKHLEMPDQTQFEIEMEVAEAHMAYTAMLNKILSTLEPAEQKILRLRYIENLSNKEIAVRMNWKEDGIKSKKWLAVQKLRKKFPRFIKRWRVIISLLATFNYFTLIYV